MKRARRSFWLLVGVAVLAVGGVSTSFAAEPSPLTALTLAAGGLVAVISLAFAARVMFAIERARRRS